MCSKGAVAATLLVVAVSKGDSGGFSGTNGNPQTELDIGTGGDKPRSGNTQYNGKKMEEYLLNPNHPKGGSKAIFLKDVLGYGSGDGKLLHGRILSAVASAEPTTIVSTEYGVKYHYEIKLPSKEGGKTANVVVVLQRDNSKDKYRIITLYPGKKSQK